MRVGIIESLFMNAIKLHMSFLQAFDGDEFLKLLKQLLQIDSDWVPHSQEASLYVRPTFISTDVSLI